jgi:spermidine synthase
LIERREGVSADYRVIVREEGRYLLGDGTIQTVASTETGDPLHRAAAALGILDLLRDDTAASPEGRGNSLLVIGLRGGTLAKRFAREGWRVRAVEADPLAIRISEDRFGFDRTEVPVAATDPRVFARRGSGRFAAVVVDAFGHSAIPFHLVTREFFTALAARLLPGGVLALAVETQGWNDPLVAALAATLRTRFPTVLALPTGEPPTALGSMVLLASDRPLTLPDERLPDPTHFHANPERHWSVVQMNHAWFNRFEPAAGAVLTDDRSPSDLWSARIQHAARIEVHEFLGSRGKSW